MKLISANNCTRAWLDACAHLAAQPKERDYNIILEVADPMRLPPPEKAVYAAVNKFLVQRKKQSLNTVINTIFPAGFYARQGSEKVITHYAQIAAKVRKHPDVRWGTYAYRMMAERTDRHGRKFMPLQAIIDKLRVQLKNPSTLRGAYELNLVDPITDIPIYEADKDHDHTIGGPCLSHVSFKLKDDQRLMLTAFYRSHYYVQRALGNLYGLAWLQDFVAKEVGINRAELICISSMAVLENDKTWGKTDTLQLLKRCQRLLDSTVPELHPETVAVSAD